MATEGINRKLTAILSADAVGYSRLMAGDEVATVQQIKTYRELISVRVKEHRGRVVDSPGDNLLAEFPSALDVVRCGVEIQGMLKNRNTDLPTDRRMEFRIGIHLGDVMVDGDRIYGDGVNIASRLEGLADPGGICISSTVYEQLRNRMDIAVQDIGPQSIKNIPEPVNVHRILLDKPEIQSSRATGESFADKPSIIVLPFDDMSPGGDNAYFSDGLTEEIITDLSNVHDLLVISRNSAMTYKGTVKRIPEIAKEVNVRYVLEGSVRKAGSSLRITAQLIDAPTDTHLWAEKYSGDMEDVFDIQEKVSRAIADALRLRLSPEEEQRIADIPIDNMQAYECYLRANHEIYTATEGSLEKALKYLKSGLDVVGENVTLYFGMGYVYWTFVHMGIKSDEGILFQR